MCWDVSLHDRSNFRHVEKKEVERENFDKLSMKEHFWIPQVSASRTFICVYTSNLMCLIVNNPWDLN